MPPPFGSGYFSSVNALVVWQLASIVPPPFGSGYESVGHPDGQLSLASIVPPPFGSGYKGHRRPTYGEKTLQLCRPLSGAVMLQPF